ncbi:hypothetical protein [Streptomyces sp. SID13031]|nr:hypothetical protein [Streptomyces sp. SID13031]NEA36817.1 hypothetical protein [Streptomyces sp. SID13031]
MPSTRRTLAVTTVAVVAVVTAVALPLFQPWRLFTGKVSTRRSLAPIRSP